MNNYTIIDGLSNPRVFKSTETAGVHTVHHNIDSLPPVVTGGLTDEELRATPVPVDGSGATQPVSGTFWQATQPVSGPLTNAELRATPVPCKLGSGDITQDAWGIQKMSLPHSLFHGLWTFDIPLSMWFLYHGATQVYESPNIVSHLGAARITADVTNPAPILESRECPRYQPNRGHLFSTALWCPLKTADGIREWGLRTAENGVFFRLTSLGLYAVVRSGGVETEALIDTSGFDVELGNVYDIQYQWRGLGNYKFFINLQLVHTFSFLGTLTALSMENPALPVSFRCTRTTADVAMHIGCCDITSENGSEGQEQPQVASATLSGNHSDTPIISIHNPLQIASKTNTRTIVIDSLSVNSANKATFKVWVTRDPAHITGASFAAVAGTGSLTQVDTAATAITAGPRIIATIPVEGTTRTVEQFTGNSRIRFTLVRGDYLVITRTGSNAEANVTIRWGEEV